MIQRKGIIIYFDDKEVINKLDKTIVNVYYISKQGNYAIIYCDANRYKPLCAELKNMKGITGFEDSLLDVEKNNF